MKSRVRRTSITQHTPNVQEKHLHKSVQKENLAIDTQKNLYNAIKAGLQYL